MAEHYFSATPGSGMRTRDIEIAVWGRRIVLTTSSGVFANGRLDLGTSVLFRETTPPARAGTFLDLGCGYGPIACALSLTVPAATVWAVDVNERAREVCVRNADRLGVADRIHVAAPDEVPASTVFAEIWSNPPIRIGKPALHELLQTWLARLESEGTASMVVSKHLGADSLQRWLDVQGYPTRRTASAKGFRVLRSTRPDARP